MALAASGVLLLAGLVALWLWWPAPEPGGEVRVVSATEEEWVGEPAALAPGTPAAAPATRTEVEDAVRRADFTRPTTVSARCVSAARPVAGCAVSLRILRAPGRHDPDVAHTDAMGRFTVTIPHESACEVVLRAPGLATSTAIVAPLPPGTAADLGDLHLERGYRIAGTIRGEEGDARPGVLLVLVREPRRGELTRRTRALRQVQVQSDAFGHFEIADLVVPGRWRIGAADMTRVHPTAIVVEPASGDQVDVRVTVHGAVLPQITGVVRDERGVPVARAEVEAFLPDQDERGERVYARTSTAANGTFTLRGGADAPEKAPAVLLRARAEGHEFTADARRHEWGARGIDLFVARQAVIAVRVGLGDGRPCERFNLHVFGPRPESVAEVRPRSRGYHADGIAFAHGVTAGPQVVYVDPGEHLVADGLLRFTHHGGSARFDILVERAVTGRVRVVSADGTPVVGATVELLLPLGDRPIRDLTPAARLYDLWELRGERALRVASAVTGAGGEAEVRGHPATRYTLRVRSFDQAPSLQDVVLTQVPQPLEVRMPTGARIDGFLQPPDSVADMRAVDGNKGPKVALVCMVDGTEVRIQPARPLRDDGKFTFTCVPPGDYTLEWTWDMPGGASGTVLLTPGDARRPGIGQVRREPWKKPRWSSREKKTLRRVLASVHGLGEGETRTLFVDARDLRLASLRGRLVGDCAWVTAARLVAIESEQKEVVLPLDEEREVWIRALPGSYRCEVRGRDTASWVLTGHAIELRPGETAVCAWSIDLPEVELRLTDARGRPVEDVELILVPEGERVPRVRTSSLSPEAAGATTLPACDADGVVRARLLPGRYTVKVGEHVAGSVEVPAPAGAPLRIELPPKALRPR